MAAEQVFEQLPLGIQLRDDATFENFYADQAQQVVEQVRMAAHGAGEQSIYISGPLGSGCSHLLQAACHEAENQGLNSVYLPLEEIVHYSSAIFESLEQLPLIALDNLEAIAGKPQWEEAVFHLYNRVRDNGGRLLLAAQQAPDALNIQLPDLLSRLQWGLVYRFVEADEAFKMAAFQLRAQNRGLEFSEEVAKYVVRHVEGHMDTMFDVLTLLDSASLTEQRRITRPFVKEVMAW